MNNYKVVRKQKLPDWRTGGLADWRTLEGGKNKGDRVPFHQLIFRIRLLCFGFKGIRRNYFYFNVRICYNVNQLLVRCINIINSISHMRIRVYLFLSKSNIHGFLKLHCFIRYRYAFDFFTLNCLLQR